MTGTTLETVVCSDCGRRIANTPEANAEFHRGHTHGHGTCMPCFETLPPGLQDRVLGVYDAKFKMTPAQLADLDRWEAEQCKG